jgi:tetratricopeptide (TPR) repeat protein
MNTKVLRRFIFLMFVLTVGGFMFWDVIGDFVDRPPGDYHTEVGSNRLVDGRYDEAMEEFNKALEESPDHRIERLEQSLAAEPDDPTGQGVLAAAFANRGIVHDRRGQYQDALADYIAALRTDAGAVEGPDIFQKILLGGDQISTVRKRAEYLHKQLQLPEEERLLRVPELDEQQFMYKP